MYIYTYMYILVCGSCQNWLISYGKGDHLLMGQCLKPQRKSVAISFFQKWMMEPCTGHPHIKYGEIYW